MRAVVLGAAIAALASFAFAAPPAYVLDPLFAAPIDRALENIEQSEMPEDRREALLARLNLLAWSRDNADFYYRRSDQRIYGWGGAPCPPGPPYHVTPSAPIEPGDLCAMGMGSIASWYGGSMPRETPAAPSEAALARLDAARMHYARAVELNPDDLWMRLGYAYTLDRQQRTDEARAQLRAIMQIGRRVLARKEVWGWQVDVLREAADQLEHLAVSRRDRQSLRRLRARMERVEIGPPPISPIMVPLADASFDDLVDLASPVGWNFSGQRVAPPRGWLCDNAAWLVWDPNRRAQITSGFDMIGERAWGVFWRDGFEALRALDDNRDGEVSGAELGGLALWRDTNGDGVSQSSEVRPLAYYGVVGLAVRGTPTRPGLITAPAGVRLEDGRTRPLYDWTPGLASAPNS
jgi:hypothetical protein